MRLSWKKSVADEITKKAFDKLEGVGNEIKSLSQERCPVDTGTLRGSAQVVRENDKIIIGYGGAASSYSVQQHEDMSLHHPVGQAKFLESAFDEIAPTIKERLKGLI